MFIYAFPLFQQNIEKSVEQLIIIVRTAYTLGKKN